MQIVVVLVATTCVHEAGHVAAAVLLRLHWEWPSIRDRRPSATIGRPEIDMARWQLQVTSLGGPLFNVLLAVVCAKIGLDLLAVANVVFAGVNLLPLPHSDGSRILRPGRALRAARAAQPR